MGNTFNVREFNTIYTMLEDNSNRITSKGNEIVSLCEGLSQLIKSTDSNLSSSYLKLGEALNMAKSKVVSLLNQLEAEMKAYETRTITNEEETETKLKEINENIENIASVFNGIAEKNS